jgi:hypothetical protein
LDEWSLERLTDEPAHYPPQQDAATVYIHPSNRYLAPGVVEPAFNPEKKARTLDWFFDRHYADAVMFQNGASGEYAAARELRLVGSQHIPGAYRRAIKEFDEEARSLSFKARARLFLLIGDGRPWNDNRLDLWEGATI